MMGDLLRILRDSELDRESKLRIIEIISTSQDEALVGDLVAVLKEWDASDNKIEKDTLAEIEKVEARYKEELGGIEQKTQASLERIEDEVEREDSIGDIKKTLD